MHRTEVQIGNVHGKTGEYDWRGLHNENIDSRWQKSKGNDNIVSGVNLITTPTLAIARTSLTNQDTLMCCRFIYWAAVGT